MAAIAWSTLKPGLGLATRLRARLPQCTLSVDDPAESTAQALWAEAEATASRWLPDADGLRLSTRFHDLSFQCMITVDWEVPSTAQTARAELADTLNSRETRQAAGSALAATSDRSSAR